ncbi:tRNA-dihydrouridine synthase [Perkinsela sp. CCAP 1560/4]|nr:tRNA-dihydrouridine synthase [Perkinsela sp. CCAP 1560/4]|eukprot:KNH03846.1 tRNA-dihydrouridine synthase [Perkinsela sp. CCAP 1560/4]
MSLNETLRRELLSFQPPQCGPAAKPPKYMEYYKSLGSPRHVVAPMVDQSELAFRMLCRRYGADLCYTPMFHSQQFCTSEAYRLKHFTTCAQDRPLLVQFCGHDPDVVVRAAKYVQNQCDGIDLNLGCPQGIARKGHYGSFLMEDWKLIHTIIRKLCDELDVPVTAKIRVFNDEEVTLAYVRMLVNAGISLLAIHGRTRDMKGGQTGVADWAIIRRVKECFPFLPIIANGNILCYDDIGRCLDATRCDGVMSAEALLHDPRLFSPQSRSLGLLNSRLYKKLPLTNELIHIVSSLTDEYLQLVEECHTVFSHVKSHLFKLLYHLMVHQPELREALNNAHEGLSIAQVRACVQMICSKSTEFVKELEISKPVSFDGCADV